MITEKQVVAAVPSHGFLREYVRFAAKSCDCHAAYHLLGGLTLLSMTIPQEFFFPYGAGETRSNFYGLAVGESSRSRKTAAVQLAERMLQKVAPDCVMPRPGSPQVLIDSIVERPQQTVFYPEFGAFLSATESGYLRPLRTDYTELYDCTPLARDTVDKRRRNKRATQDNPRLSMLAAVAPGFLEGHTLAHDWTEGFLARFLTMYAEREREKDLPPYLPKSFEALVRMLEEYRDTWLGLDSPPLPCQGFSDDAVALWRAWSKRSERAVEGSPWLVRAAVSRAQGHARKIAPLIEWDLGAPRTGRPWSVSAEALASATAIAQLHIHSVMELAKGLAPDEAMQIRRRVLRAVKTEPTLYGRIIAEAQITARRGMEMIDTLLEEGLIMRVQRHDGKRCYMLAPDEDAADGTDNVIQF